MLLNGVKFANAEGIVPAPEATHAVKGAMDAATDQYMKGNNFYLIYVVMVILICRLTVITLTTSFQMLNIMKVKYCKL